MRHDVLLCRHIVESIYISIQPILFFLFVAIFAFILILWVSKPAFPSPEVLRCRHQLFLLNLSQKKNGQTSPSQNQKEPLLTMRNIMTMETLSEISSLALPTASRFHLLLRQACQVLDPQDW